MARKLRVQYQGAVYHVISRGDRRERNSAALFGKYPQGLERLAAWKRATAFLLWLLPGD
jgi:hypothetical protein